MFISNNNTKEENNMLEKIKDIGEYILMVMGVIAMLVFYVTCVVIAVMVIGGFAVTMIVIFLEICILAI